MFTSEGVNQTACKHCKIRDEPHVYVCDCGHSHNEHVYGGGCKVKNCGCEQYSQVKMVKVKESINA
jgi:hypothetical protein